MNRKRPINTTERWPYSQRARIERFAELQQCEAQLVALLHSTRRALDRVLVEIVTDAPTESTRHRERRTPS